MDSFGLVNNNGAFVVQVKGRKEKFNEEVEAMKDKKHALLEELESISNQVQYMC